MSPPLYRRFREGMVLFEVIMALSVFALVAMALVMALDASMDAAWQREKIETALLGLENQMAQLHNTRLVPGENDLPDDGSGVAYSIKIELARINAQKNIPLNGIYRVTVTAKWKDGSDEESRDLSQLFYQP
jgi:hypothetical protein